jgi:2-phospho-L-lactate/phosphoenolpyruvate guanylyltransferase
MSGMTADTVRPSDAPGTAWSLVLPLKPLARAKSRLAAAVGPLRPELALAFALDTVAAALACSAVARVLVVTDDVVAAREVGAAGALVVPDEPDAGLNAALAHGALRAAALSGGGPVAAMSADLPALRAEELGRVLGAARRHGRAFLADARGVGTTLLAANGEELEPAFGGASRARHAASGAAELGIDGVESVRRDVDTGADLREALRLGVGPHTAGVVAGLSFSPHD